MNVITSQGFFFFFSVITFLKPTFIFLMLPTISYGEGNGNPFQYSCLENPTDKGAWWAAVHGVAKSLTRLSV